MSHLQTLTLGMVLASAIAAAAWRAGALTASGTAAAVIVGACAAGAGWSWAALVIVYFVTAVAWSRFHSADKAARTAGRLAKAGARDAIQVAANGAVFTAAALGHQLAPDPLWQMLAAGGLAASAADTWATEIGTLARATPRSIVDFAPVPPGTSGGVTVAGSLAGLAGAVVVGVTALASGWPLAAGAAAVTGGVLGCGLDSVLGAVAQCRRWCATCSVATEQRRHSCGADTAITGGIRWLDNDGVNAVSTLGGALFGATAGRYF